MCKTEKQGPGNPSRWMLSTQQDKQWHANRRHRARVEEIDIPVVAGKAGSNPRHAIEAKRNLTKPKHVEFGCSILSPSDVWHTFAANKPGRSNPPIDSMSASMRATVQKFQGFDLIGFHFGKK